LSLSLKGLPPSHAGTLHEWIGRPAMAIGLLYVGSGLFAHFHWFWSNHASAYRYYEIGQLMSLVVLVASVAWWIAETIW
jgi:hypothetical protein